MRKRRRRFVQSGTGAALTAPKFFGGVPSLPRADRSFVARKKRAGGSPAQLQEGPLADARATAQGRTMDEPFVRPDVRQLLEFLDNVPGPKGHEVGPEAARQMMVAARHALDAPAREIAMLRDIDAPVPLRLYDPRPERAPGPVLLFIPGGDWVIG